MKREIETKFYAFDQNNSGGYFIDDEQNGVCEVVIIEAQNANEANSKLNEIGEKVDGFDDFCPCCGERWYYVDESEARETPSIYSTPIEEYEGSMFRKACYIHYYDGTIKFHEFKKKDQ